MGRTLDDVRSIVLTHGHSDHVGFAERGRSERGWPVLVHELDAALARGEVPNPAKGGGPMRPLPLLGFLWWSLRHGPADPPSRRGRDVRRRGHARRPGVAPGHAGARAHARQRGPALRRPRRAPGRRCPVHVRGDDRAQRAADRPVLRRSRAGPGQPVRGSRESRPRSSCPDTGRPGRRARRSGPDRSCGGPPGRGQSGLRPRRSPTRPGIRYAAPVGTIGSARRVWPGDQPESMTSGRGHRRI